MSAETKIFLKGRIAVKEISDFLGRNTDIFNVSDDIVSHTTERLKSDQIIIDNSFDKNKLVTENGKITVVMSNGYSRKFFYSYSNYHFTNLAQVFTCEEKKIAVTEKTFLAAASDNLTLDILSSIVNHFGGWICKNDERFIYERVTPNE